MEIEPYYLDDCVTIYQGHALDVLKQLPDESVQVCLTSPPYWGLRQYKGGSDIVWGGDPNCDHVWEGSEYHEHRVEASDMTKLPRRESCNFPGHALPGDHQRHISNVFCVKCGAYKGQLGLEPTPELYVEHRGKSLSGFMDTSGICVCHATEISHFAVFPQRLPEICILASTSEKGNCTKCGMPWVRKVDKFWEHQEQAPKDRAQDVVGNPMFRGGHHNDGLPYTGGVETLGWLPSCQCNAPAEPAVVLDPFAGSGTTLAVAKTLSRKGIGIDISEAYCKLIVRRLGKVSLPMALWG